MIKIIHIQNMLTTIIILITNMTPLPLTLSPLQRRPKGKNIKKEDVEKIIRWGNRDNILQIIMLGGGGMATGKKWKRRVEIIIEWSKNAFREVPKSNIFLPYPPLQTRPKGKKYKKGQNGENYKMGEQG